MKKYDMHYTEKRNKFTLGKLIIMFLLGLILGLSIILPSSRTTTTFYYFPDDAETVFNEILVQFCEEKTGRISTNVHYNTGYEYIAVSCFTKEGDWFNSEHYSKKDFNNWLDNLYKDNS